MIIFFKYLEKSLDSERSEDGTLYETPDTVKESEYNSKLNSFQFKTIQYCFKLYSSNIPDKASIIEGIIMLFQIIINISVEMQASNDLYCISRLLNACMCTEI